MACVGVSDGVAVVAFDPCEGGVAEPVGGDLLGCDPGEVVSDAMPEVVVAAGRDGPSVGVAEKLLFGVIGAAVIGVSLEVGHEGGDGLPAVGPGLFAEQDQALGGVEVMGL